MMAIEDINFGRAGLSYNDLALVSGFKSNAMLNDYLQLTTNSENLATQAVINRDNFTGHDESTSEHGVTGDNVGSEDFATDIVGGVVMIMALVSDAVDSVSLVTLADVAASPAAYDQAYSDLQTGLINDVKAKHNALIVEVNLAISQLNELIANSKTARQMSL